MAASSDQQRARVLAAVKALRPRFYAALCNLLQYCNLWFLGRAPPHSIPYGVAVGGLAFLGPGVARAFRSLVVLRRRRSAAITSSAAVPRSAASTLEVAGQDPQLPGVGPPEIWPFGLDFRVPRSPPLGCPFGRVRRRATAGSLVPSGPPPCSAPSGPFGGRLAFAAVSVPLPAGAPCRGAVAVRTRRPPPGEVPGRRAAMSVVSVRG